MVTIALTATALSIEFILAVCALLSKVPIPVDLAYAHLLTPPLQRTFQPKRDLFFYALWIALGVGIYLGLLWLKKWSQNKQRFNFKKFLMIHAMIAAVMCHAGFEIVALGNPIWAWPVFWGSFAVGLLISIFWPEFNSGLALSKSYYSSLKLKPRVGAVAGCLFIFLVIFMPDLQAVVAMIYMQGYFHNWDVCLFGAVYAISHGLIPCVDVITTYAFGAAVMTAKLVNLMGGFDYTKVLGILMWVGIIYFSLWFLLLRRVLASGLLAFAAIVWGMRVQMFNLQIAPFIWDPVMDTVFRYCFDIGVFWMIWMHIQTRRMIFLAVGAVIVSLGLYHMFTTGVSIFLMFGLYVFLSAFVPCLGGRKDRLLWRNHALMIGSVFVWTGLWFYLTMGKYIVQASFWHNMSEYSTYFFHGVYSDLLTRPIKEDVVRGIGGLVYPVFYMGTFLIAAGTVFEGRARARDVFVALLAFYGLELHAYYIVMASQWYMISLPGIFLFFYWIDRALEKAPLPWRRRIAWGLVGLALYCLMTDQLFAGYPNLLNFSRNPIVDSRTAIRLGPHHIASFHQLMADFPESFKLPLNSIGEKDEGFKFEKDFSDQEELKTYYEQQTAFPEDAAMIRRLTPEGERAAVLSSFEILLLQKADRKPFFYYFPLINSRPMTIRNFMVTEVFGSDQLQKIVNQLDAQKPRYIFMERIFLTPQVPQAYFYEYQDLIVLLRYVLSNYEPEEVGKYLVAMKRK